MNAFVTSIGEVSTELCVWALERNGFAVTLLEDKGTTLAQKLQQLYSTAQTDFLRVDADIVVNRNLTPSLLSSLDDPEIWWWQFLTFDWFKQDTTHSLAYIKIPALSHLRLAIGEFLNDVRPETMVSRIEELHNPRRMKTYEDKLMGLHGYGVKDLRPVMSLKAFRGQSHLYDFELAERLNTL